MKFEVTPQQERRRGGTTDGAQRLPREYGTSWYPQRQAPPPSEVRPGPLTGHAAPARTGQRAGVATPRLESLLLVQDTGSSAPW